MTKQVETIVNELKIWFSITENSKVLSCKGAANNRKRIGFKGIPLMDELKSNLVFYINNRGNKKYALIHCRGNQLLDFDKLNNLFHSQVQRVSSSELKNKFQLNYGTVNPFVLMKNTNIIQIFDSSITRKYLPPYTMMTNASHVERGIEFYPNELIGKLENAIVGDIIQNHTYPTISPYKIGILTGNSPESGIMLWEKLNFHIRDQLSSKFIGDFSFPHILIESLPEMGLSIELESRELPTKVAVLRGIENLCENGANLICVACNTTQFFEKEINEICNKYKAKFISMIESLKLHLDGNGIEEFDFLSIKSVADFQKWSAFKPLKKDYKINLPNEKILSQISNLSFEVKKNRISSKGINKLRDLINNSTINNNIVIALTELSILIEHQKNRKKSSKNYIDTLSVLAERIATIYVTEIKKAYTIPKSK